MEKHVFPQPNEKMFLNELTQVQSGGMTLRQYYAGLAMQSLLDKTSSFTSSKALADMSVKCADALLAALEEPKP